MSRPHRLPLVGLGLAAAASPSPLAAQTHAGQAYASELSPASAEPTLLALAGDFTADGVPDAALLRGAELVVAYAPALYDSLVLLAADVRGAALLEGAGPAGEDQVVGLQDAGAQLFTWDEAEGAFDAQDLGLEGGSVLRAGARAGVTTLSSISSDGSTVSHWQDQAGTWTSVQTLVPVGRAKDVLLADWNADGARETIVLSDAGVEIFDPAGNPSMLHPQATDDDAIAALADPFGDGDLILWYTFDSIGGQRLVIAFNEDRVEAPIQLGAHELGELRFHDYDQDGFEDLLLALKDPREAWLLHNATAAGDPSGSTFLLDCTSAFPCLFDLDLDPTQTLPPAARAPVSASADLDRDGDLDFVAVDDLDRILVLHGHRVSEEPETIAFGHVDHQVTNLGQGSPAPTTIVHFETTMQVPQTQVVPAPTDIEYRVWAQDSVDGELRPDLVASGFLTLPTVPQPMEMGGGQANLPQSPSALVPFDMDFSIDDFPADGVLQILVRRVTRDGQGALVHRLAPSVLHWTSDDDVLGALGALPVPGTFVWSIIGVDPGGGNPGGVVRRPKIRPLLLGNPPR